MTPYYQDDLVTLYCGDSYELIDELPKPDLLLTDPPYEIEMNANMKLFGKTRNYQRESAGFTDMGFNVEILAKFDNWMSFCSLTQVPKLIGQANGSGNWMLLTWHKSNPIPLCRVGYLPDTEYIIHKWSKGRLFGRYHDKTRYIVHPCRQDNQHPNQKPLPVLAKLVTLGSQKGELVMDIFAGSGTTGVICKQMGRRCVLIEREERYCEIAAKALAQEYLAL